MTSGERRLSERLEQKLEDDYLLWYDVPVGPHQRHPDFVVLHPRRGLLVLEVKDWRPETILAADKTQFTIRSSNGSTRVVNPLLQARTYATEICSVLQRDPALRGSMEDPHPGKLLLPWGYGVVLSNISRKQFVDGGLDQVIPSHLVLCQDEMFEHVEEEAFSKRLWDMFPHVFPVALTLPQMDRVRWHLFPEVRVTPGDGQFGLFAEPGTSTDPGPIPDLIRVMDQHQEQLARSLGDHHRIIHGVAGSGKTMILGFRAAHLARATHKPILILCYNRTLASRLERLCQERGIATKAQVYTFHRWCAKMLSTYHVPQPTTTGDERFAESVRAVIAGVERGAIPRFQYAAVLIDEGHDFEPEWYQLVVQMVDPTTNSLLVLYDSAQNINGNPSRRTFSWKSVGIQAQGRTTILRLNYRNTLEVLAVARNFARELLNARDEGDDGVPLISPESAGRRGPAPELLRLDSARHEQDAVIARIHEELAQGRSADEIAILVRWKWQASAYQAALDRCGIRAHVASDQGKSTLFTDGGTVKIMTLHSSKGLEFQTVIIPDIGAMPKPPSEEADEARLLYVGMTRAMDRLILTCHGDSVFTRRLRAAINEIQIELASSQERAV